MNNKKAKQIRSAMKKAGKDWRIYKRAYKQLKKTFKKGIPVYDKS